jgi:hypothetical protein
VCSNCYRLSIKQLLWLIRLISSFFQELSLILDKQTILGDFDGSFLAPSRSNLSAAITCHYKASLMHLHIGYYIIKYSQAFEGFGSKII